MIKLAAYLLLMIQAGRRVMLSLALLLSPEDHDRHVTRVNYRPRLALKA